jgi:type III restriction enzyme
MALHPNFSSDPHAVLDPGFRWFPADEALREARADQRMPPLVSDLLK